MNTLSIDLFGVPEVRLQGSRVHLRRRHAVALLGYLVLTGRSHAREDVAALLGGDLSEESARKLMRNALGDLRNGGLGDFIRADRHSVAFVTDAATVDVIKLDAIHAQGNRATTADLAWGASFSGRELLSGLSLSDGPDFEDWLRQERQHRTRQVQEIANRLLDRFESEHRLEEGIRLSRKLIDAERWNEDHHRRLMRLLAMDNQISAAKEQFRVCHELLLDELGVEPQPETLELFHQLSEKPTSLRNNVADFAHGMPDPVIGRSHSIESILKNLFLPDCRLVSVTGLKGSGRSTIVKAVASHLVEPQMFLERHRFADGVFISDLAGAGGSDLVTEESAVATAVGTDLGLVFYANVDSQAHLLSYLATKRMLLILDNFEIVSRENSIVKDILSTCPGVSIMLTARESRGIGGEWIEVADGLSLPSSDLKLADSDAGKLLLREASRLRARTRESDAPYLAEMCNLVGGHPLALAVLAAWLRVLPAREIVWQLSNAGPILFEPVVGFADLSLSLRQIASSDLNTMSPGSLDALYRLSVFHGRFDISAVRAVGVRLERVDDLLRRNVLDFIDATYSVHPLIRLFGRAHLIADAKMAHEVRNIHGEHFAAFIKQHAGSLNQDHDVFELVDAFVPDLFASWDWSVEKRATENLFAMLPGMTTWSELAGRHDEWANVLARSSRNLAENLTPDADPNVHRVICSLLLAEADAVHWQGEYNRAIRAMLEARRHADAVDDNVLRARISLRQARILHYQGNEEQVLPLLQEARNLAIESRDSSLLAFCMMVSSAIYIDYGLFLKATQALDRAESEFLSLGESGSLARVYLDRGRAWSISGDFTRARVALEQAIYTSKQFHDKPDEAWSTAYLGKVLGDGFGEHGEARDRIDRAHELSAEISERMFTSYVLWVDGRNALHIGDFERARERLEGALELGRHLVNAVNVSRVLCSLGQLALLLGDALPAQGLVDQSVQIARDARRRTQVAAALVVLGQTYEAQNLLENSAMSYSRARAIASNLGMDHLVCDANAGLASVTLRRGDLQLACSHARDALAYLESHALCGCEDPAWVITSMCSVFRAAGDLRAESVLQTGYQLLHQRATSLPEGERDRYLQATPARREVISLVQSG